MRYKSGTAELKFNVVYIFNPYDSSSYTFNISSIKHFISMKFSNGIGEKVFGVHKSTETISGFNILFIKFIILTSITVKYMELNNGR